MNVEITTFGFRHGDPPAAHLTLDLRQHFRDPHVSKDLRYKTAEDADVRENVLKTPGVEFLLVSASSLVEAFAQDPKDHDLRIAVGCAGGRHRAATVGMTLAERLEAWGHKVTLTHRDIKKGVVAR
jgi:UPF0042 nucleotide-binding protein